MSALITIYFNTFLPCKDFCSQDPPLSATLNLTCLINVDNSSPPVYRQLRPVSVGGEERRHGPPGVSRTGGAAPQHHLAEAGQETA